jgi:hypothetical protein
MLEDMAALQAATQGSYVLAWPAWVPAVVTTKKQVENQERDNVQAACVCYHTHEKRPSQTPSTHTRMLWPTRFTT